MGSTDLFTNVIKRIVYESDTATGLEQHEDTL